MRRRHVVVVHDTETNGPDPEHPMEQPAIPSRPTTATLPKHAKPTTGYATKAEADKARARIAELNDIADRTQKWVLGIGSVALAFTITNVTIFATDHGIPGWIAWILDLAVNAALVRVLYVDGRLAILIPEYKPSGWSLFLRYFAFFSTWLMNAWVSLYPGGHFVANPLQMRPDPAGLLLHSVMPFLVFGMAEFSSHNRKISTDQITALQAIVDSYEEGVKVEQANEAARLKAKKDRAEAERQRKENEERDRIAEIDRRRREDEERRRQQQIEDEEADRAHRREMRRLELAAKQAAADAQAEKARAAAKAALIEAQTKADIEKQRAQYALQKQAQDDEAARKLKEMQTAARLKADEEERQRRKAEEERQRRKAEEERAAAEARATEKAKRQRKLEEARARVAESKPAPAAAPTTTPSAPTSESVVSHEERRRIQEKAVEDAAKALVLTTDGKATADDKNAIAAKYGKSARWVEQRLTEARKRLAEDADFKDEMETAALNELANV